HGPRTAPATVDLGRGGLDEQLELAAVLARGENDEAGQVNDGFRAATGSVSTHWGLQRSVAWSLWIMRPQPLLSHHPRWRVATGSHLHGEEPLNGAILPLCGRFGGTHPAGSG